MKRAIVVVVTAICLFAACSILDKFGPQITCRPWSARDTVALRTDSVVRVQAHPDSVCTVAGRGR